MRYRLFSLLLFFPILLSPQARRSAPQSSPDSDRLIAAHLRGSTRFTPDEIMAATGLKIGDKVNQQILNDATQRLADTGAFKELTFSFVAAPKGTTVDWQLTDNPQFITARFDNLVWFEDKDLVARLHEQLPLFKGELPLTGKLGDQVRDAIQKLLAARDIGARVDFIPEAPLNGAIRAVVYHVEGFPIRVRNVSYAGADPAFSTLLQSVTSQLTQDDFLRSRTAVFAQLTLLPIYRERGYLKASFGDPEVKLTESTAQGATIDVTLPVTQGVQYRAGEIAWTGNAAIAATDLQKLLHLVPGQPVNAVALGEDMHKINTAYGAKGYLLANVKPSPVLLDDQALANYTFEVNEGDLFHFGQLEIQGGLDQATIDRLRQYWRIKPGEPYDSTYPQTFFREAVRGRVLPAGVRWNMSEHAALDRTQKVVNLTLSIAPAKNYSGNNPLLPLRN